MRVAEALTELLTNLAAGGQDTDASRAAEDRADDVIALFIQDPEQTGRTILALASFIVYSWCEYAETIDQHRAAAILATPPEGDPVPFFVDFLHAMIDAAEAGEKMNERAIRLVGKLTDSKEHMGLTLWVLATYLMKASVDDPAERQVLIDKFVASALRQEMFFDVELTHEAGESES